MEEENNMMFKRKYHSGIKIEYPHWIKTKNIKQMVCVPNKKKSIFVGNFVSYRMDNDRC